jgi:glycyl-tRNA synthetase beta chain
VLENGLRIRLVQAFTQAHALYGRRLGAARDAVATARDLLTLVADRLKVHLREAGVRHDHIGAVFALEDEDDLVRLMARVTALARFLESEDGSNLLIAYRRARNIVQIEEKRDQREYREPVDSVALVEPEEQVLADALAAAELDVRAAVGAEDFALAMAHLARLREPVDAFFERVTVNAENAGLRANRLQFLAQIVRVMEGVADFGLIEG